MSEVREESRNFLNVIKSLDEDERKLRQQKIKEVCFLFSENSFLKLFFGRYLEKLSFYLNIFIKINQSLVEILIYECYAFFFYFGGILNMFFGIKI